MGFTGANDLNNGRFGNRLSWIDTAANSHEKAGKKKAESATGNVSSGPVWMSNPTITYPPRIQTEGKSSQTHTNRYFPAVQTPGISQLH